VHYHRQNGCRTRKRTTAARKSVRERQQEEEVDSLDLITSKIYLQLRVSMPIFQREDLLNQMTMPCHDMGNVSLSLSLTPMLWR
jgi:hypothetical protein